jgi:F1F0 ATPase subunit 2
MLVRLEVGEERMSFLSFDCLPSWAVFLSSAAHLTAGIALGVFHFRSLWWSTCRFTGDSRVMTMVALMIGRFTLLGGLLTLASLEGALPLLVMALGVLIARSVVVRRVREVTP